jgi:hypothetical protein
MIPSKPMHRRFVASKQPATLGKGYLWLLALSGAVLAASLVLLGFAHGQTVHRNGFESRTPVWTRGPADAKFSETVHDVTDQTAHTGQLSEHILLTAEIGSFINYQYPTARAPLAEELSARVWIKANRPGAQLMARLVLPRERNPNNLNEPVTTILRGDQYQLAGRWQPLEVRRPVKLAKDQQQLMRAEQKRDIDFTDAYIDQLILNVYGGPGQTEVWIDDLEIGPVVEGDSSPATPRLPTGPTAGGPAAGLTSAPAPRNAVIEVGDHLLVNNKRYLFRAIRHTNTPLEKLRDAGFNTVFFDCDAKKEDIDEAARLGLWIVPTLPQTENQVAWQADNTLAKLIAPFRESDAVLWYDIGGGKTAEDAPQVSRLVQSLQALDSQHPIGGDAWDGFQPYSRYLKLLGAHRWPLMTMMELPQYRDWLNQRRLLARPGTFMWTWIQTHLPDWYTSLVYEQAGSRETGFTEPIGPEPEQIRLLSYLAISAGSQGLGFWSDQYLADSHQGRDRLLALALLNQEIQMLEPMLLSVVEPPIWIDTNRFEVKAAVIRTEKGVLVLPMWIGPGSQFVPGQAAVGQLSITVPQVPTGTQAWEISPGDVHALKIDRITGGSKITLPEFGLTSAIVFTSDNSPTGMLVRFQEQARRSRKKAAEMMYDLAVAESEKILQVETELEKEAHILPDGKQLIDDSKNRLQVAKKFLDGGDYRQAYLESQRALRPLRILMRAQWEQAIKTLDTPVASIYAVSYYTLPKHYEYMKQVGRMRIGNNVLPEGGFESPPDKAPASWMPQEVSLDEVSLAAWRVAEDPQEGKRCLKLEVKPKHPENPPGALERTFLAVNSPAIKLEPGTLVRISGWVKIPKAIEASTDGVLFYDSAGGEPLAVRLTTPTGWRKYTLYRKVPANGTIQLTVALTGIGTAYFDDLRIEPMVAGSSTTWSRPAAMPQGPAAPHSAPAAPAGPTPPPPPPARGATPPPLPPGPRQ